MSAPQRLPGEVWRGEEGGHLFCVTVADMTAVVWRDYDGEWHPYTTVAALKSWALAMMAERDEAQDLHTSATVEIDELRAEVARLRGLPPSLPGYGHDEEPAEDRVRRHDDWYQRAATAPITKPREP